MSEMRTEMVYVNFPYDDDMETYEQCGIEDADASGIIFTADHPTEVTPEGTPQEYGIMVITEDLFKAISDIDEYIINEAVRALKDAGCLLDD